MLDKAAQVKLIRNVAPVTFIQGKIINTLARVIGICGPSGGGKTTFANQLLKKLTKENAVLISADDYWKYDRPTMNKLNITGYDWESRDKEKLLEDIAQTCKQVNQFLSQLTKNHLENMK